MNKLQSDFSQLLDKLAGEIEGVLHTHGVVSIDNGDYWVRGPCVDSHSVEVYVFYKKNFTADLLADCSALLDRYPDDFVILFIEAGRDGKPLEPLGGMKLSRFSYEVL